MSLKEAAAETTGAYGLAVKAFKRQMLLGAIAEEKGNLCRVSVRLGIHRNTVNRVMRETGVTTMQVREYLRMAR
jgi:DNA-binding NtrC family response regulator